MLDQCAGNSEKQRKGIGGRRSRDKAGMCLISEIRDQAVCRGTVSQLSVVKGAIREEIMSGTQG